ncbi:MAG TPA: acylneuraminate cytidylyltransferase family protein [Candidatus Parcubacteria bacterium]|nr:acylneuraminate cytidylyltransferase family protein [Candidatus Parcubacteria bacterium]
MKIIAIICARGGSKRLPQKNIKLLAGKPLIAYAIEVALKCKMFDRVIGSTEDKEIAKISKKFGAEVPFIRPKDLARGKVSVWSVLQYVVRYLAKTENYIPDVIVSLSPTSPFRRVEDIKKCLKKLVREKADIVTTVYESDRNPYFNMIELRKGKVSLVKKPQKKITQGQDAPKVYSLNDAVKAIRRNALLKNDSLFALKNIKFVIMPRERSIDIDDPLDFLVASLIIKNKLKCLT